MIYLNEKTLEKKVAESSKKIKLYNAFEFVQKVKGSRASFDGTDNHYFEDGKYLFYFSRWLGNFAFTKTAGAEQTEFKFWSLSFFYTVIRFISLSTIILLHYGEKMDAAFQEKSIVNGVLNKILLMVPLHVNLVIPLCYFYQIKDMIVYHNLWRAFQEEYTNTLGERITFGLKSFVQLSLAVLIVFPFLQLIILLGVLDNSEYSNLTVFEIVSFIAASYSIFTFVLTWYFNSFAIQIAIKRISHHTVQALKRKYSGPDLRDIRDLWLQIYALVKAFGSAELAAFSVILIALFTVFIMSVYGILICIFDYKFGSDIFIYIFYGLFSFFYLFMLTDCAHQIKDEIGFKFSKKFLEVNMSDFDEEKQMEVEKFLEAMAMEHPEINIAGFLEVDRSLIVKFMATTVTYLIVLLQFKASSEVKEQDISV